METPNFNVEKFPTRNIFIIFRSRYIKVFNFDVPIVVDIFNILHLRKNVQKGTKLLRYCGSCK